MPASHVTKSVLATVLAALMAGGVLHAGDAQAADGRLKEILDRGAVRVGLQGAFRPWSFPATDGSLQGIEVDLAKSVADALGVEMQPVIITSANRMQLLQQNQIDLIIGGMYDTAERRQIVGMIEPAYWSSGPTLLARKGVIKSWDDIAGKPVCGKQGNYYNKQVETDLKATVVAFTGNTEGKEALRAGRCIAWLYDDASVKSDLQLPEWADYEMAVEPLFTNPWAAAVPLDSRDSGWGIFMSGMAYRWQADGTLLELSKKWGIEPGEWFISQNERLRWDESYLEPQQ